MPLRVHKLGLQRRRVYTFTRLLCTSHRDIASNKHSLLQTRVSVERVCESYAFIDCHAPFAPPVRSRVALVKYIVSTDAFADKAAHSLFVAIIVRFIVYIITVDYFVGDRVKSLS